MFQIPDKNIEEIGKMAILINVIGFKNELIYIIKL